MLAVCKTFAVHVAGLEELSRVQPLLAEQCIFSCLSGSRQYSTLSTVLSLWLVLYKELHGIMFREAQQVEQCCSGLQDNQDSKSFQMINVTCPSSGAKKDSHSIRKIPFLIRHIKPRRAGCSVARRPKNSMLHCNAIRQLPL